MSVIINQLERKIRENKKLPISLCNVITKKFELNRLVVFINHFLQKNIEISNSRKLDNFLIDCVATGGSPDPSRHGDDKIGKKTSLAISGSVVTSPSEVWYERSSGTSSGQQPSMASQSYIQRLQPLSEEYPLKVFLMKLAKEIDEDELKEMKFMMKGEMGMGKRTISEIKTVKEFFIHLMEINFVDKYNLLQLQSLLWHIERKDLHSQLVTFARDYRTRPLHFFIPKSEPRNGYVYAHFHIGGELETTSVPHLEKLRQTIADYLCVPAKFIFIKGIEPLHSLIVTLMVPELAVFALFELSDIEKSTLQSLRIDSFRVGRKRVILSELKFEKAATLSEEEEINRILKKKEFLTSELDKSQARLVERSKALSSSQEELAKVKVTSDQLKMANDRAMMILATLVYQDLIVNSSTTDSLCRLSIIAYFKFCLRQFRSRFPEAAKHVGDLLEANALVVRRTERDSHRNYVERLQIHQLALEHRCQTVQPTYTLCDHLFQQASASVRQQYTNPRNQQQTTRPSSFTPESQHIPSSSRRKLFDRRAEKKSESEKKPHPYKSVLKEISLKLTDAQREKLLGNIRFNKVEEKEVVKRPEKFLQILFENEMGEIPADPCEHVLRKLKIIGNKDLDLSAHKLLSKQQKDLKQEAESSTSSSGHQKPSNTFAKSFYKSTTPTRQLQPSFTTDQSPAVTNPMELRGQRYGEPDVHGVHRSASESVLQQHDLHCSTQEKLDKLLSDVESLKSMIQPMYRSPVGVRPLKFPSPTELGSNMLQVMYQSPVDAQQLLFPMAFSPPTDLGSSAYQF